MEYEQKLTRKTEAYTTCATWQQPTPYSARPGVWQYKIVKNREWEARILRNLRKMALTLSPNLEIGITTANNKRERKAESLRIY